MSPLLVHVYNYDFRSVTSYIYWSFITIKICDNVQLKYLNMYFHRSIKNHCNTVMDSV